MKTKYDNVFVNPTMHEVSAADATPIAFDLDSVLNEGDYLRDYVAKAFGTTMDKVKGFENGHEVFHFEIPGVSYKEMSVVINKCIYEESPSALCTPYMRSVLGWVHSKTGRPIAVVTARNPRMVGVTKRWLDEHLDGIPFNAYIINGEPKIGVLSYLGAKIFIDDRWKTIKNMVNIMPHPVLYNRPWNMGRPEELPGVVRARDLRDIIPLLNIIMGRGIMDWPWYIPHPKLTRGESSYATKF